MGEFKKDKCVMFATSSAYVIIGGASRDFERKRGSFLEFGIASGSKNEEVIII